MILPFHVEQTPIPEDDDTFIGGNGLVAKPDQDSHLWEYRCLVNDSLTSGSDDVLYYKRIYKTVLKQNAHRRRILCGILMMTQAMFTPRSTSSAVTGLRGRNSRISVPGKALEDAYATVCAIFRKYDKAALLLPSYNTKEDLILPYIVIDMNTFQFKVSTEIDVWTNPAEFKSFDRYVPHKNSSCLPHSF
jgi:hypothetical protein